MPKKTKENFLIPENLDVKNHILNNDPTPFMRKGRKFKITKMLTVIDKLYHKLVYRKENKYAHDNYIPLKLQYLRKYVDDAENYLEYLIKTGIILTDSWYIKGEKSIGYKFHSSYLGTPTVYLTRQKGEEETTAMTLIGFDTNAKKVKHLKKWFNNKLTINVADAQKEEYANYWKRDGEELPIFYDYINFSKVSNIGINRRTDKFKSKGHKAQYRSLLGGMVIPLATYENKEFTFKVDDSGYRLHTNITNLKKTIRKHVKYDGKTIVSFDIKNSQPFFLNVITSPTFWQSSEQAQHFNISFLQRPSKQFWNVYRRHRKAPLTMRAFEQTQYRTTFELFKKVTLDGSLYEFIQKKHAELTEKTIERNKVKGEFIKILYDEESIYREHIYGIEETINTVFPGLMEFCNSFKTKDEYNGLALLLQNVESTVVLRIVTANIAKEYPDMPLFTIHDSIGTTEDYAPILGPLVTSEIEKCVGLRPTIKEEKWA